MFSKKLFLLFFLMLFLFSSCFPGRQGSVPTIEITVENPLPIKRTNVPIVLKISEIKKVAEDFSPDLYIITPSEKSEERQQPQEGQQEGQQQPVKIPTQADDINYDGIKDEIVFLVDLEPEESKTVLLYYPPEDKREKVTFGHDQKTKAGIFPELGGAAIESELTAYLISLQNAVYPLGKSSSELMLNKYAESGEKMEISPIVEQESRDWIGCGGFALWKNNSLLTLESDQTERYVRVLADGPVRSMVEVIYPELNINGISLDIRAKFSIIAGHREMKNEIKVRGDKPFPQIATGLPYSLANNDRENGYAYTWNSSRSTGTGLIYMTEQFSTLKDEVYVEDKRTSRQKPTAIFDLDSNDSLTYYVIATSGQGEIGIKSRTEFEDLLDITTAQVKSPPTVEIRLQEQNEEKSQEEPKKEE